MEYEKEKIWKFKNYFVGLCNCIAYEKKKTAF